MLTTYLTRTWGLDVPVIGAPMSPMSGGRLAAALANAGALGMIGVSSTQPIADLERDIDEARRLAPGRRFGVGLMTWALDRRPELLDAALAARPFAIALSFGDASPYAARVRDAGVHLLAQVQDRKSALAAAKAGVEIVVAQGTEAGGHTGAVGTLPLLQIALESVRVPVVAAGGIASGRGLAAVLAAGAVGAWIGTPFLLAEEARNTEPERRRVIEADETSTVLTSAFDVAQQIPWPRAFGGRALANAFTEKWHGHEDALARDEDARRAFLEAKRAQDYATANVYAGQSVGLVDRVEPAASILGRIVADAEARLREAHTIVS